MPILRAVVLLMLVVTALLFLAFAITGQTRYKNYGMVVLKWTLLAGFGFFAVLIAQRLAS